MSKKPKAWPEGREPFLARYNIAPSQEAPVFVSDQTPLLKNMRWGLAPFWAKEDRAGHKMINARAETLHEKPAFRNSLKERRCLVPADSFYEWRRVAKQKLPFRFMIKDCEPFMLAGLWDRWRKPDGTALHSFTIVTTEANDLVRPLHDRMPVILDETGAAAWMGPQADLHSLSALFRPFPASLMCSHEVSAKLNDPRFDDRTCIEKEPGGMSRDGELPFGI